MDELKQREGGRWSRAGFALPYSFKPRLTLIEAALAALFTFVRIFLGCLLFAVCGSYTLAAWSRLRGLWWRVPVVLAMSAAFIVLFAGLMFSISAAARGVMRAGESHKGRN
jgi:hypothetical protein